MKHLEQRLSEKGWSKEEIAHAKKIMQKAQEKKSPSSRRIELFSYWILFFLIIMGGAVGAWLIAPFLIILSKTGALFVGGIFGLFYGALISFLVRDIERVESHHHFLVFLFVILSSIGTSIFLGFSAHKLVEEIPSITVHNPLLVGLVFSIFALIPYGIFVWLWWKEHGSL